jgi:hypothetical protein
MTTIKRPDEWCAQFGFKVEDPDGWRFGFNVGTVEYSPKPWHTPISEKEFGHRCLTSTLSDVIAFVEFLKNSEDRTIPDEE